MSKITYLGLSFYANTSSKNNKDLAYTGSVKEYLNNKGY